MSIEAMKQALEALEYVKQTYDEQGLVSLGTNTAIIDLRQAIAEAEKQEPVAWMQENQPELYVKEEKDEKRGYVIPLYTTPQQRKPLTDEQIATISVECATVSPSDIYFARAIEAAHGIKGEV
jgi:hypothetical protein